MRPAEKYKVLLLGAVFLISLAPDGRAQEKLRVVLAGLSHDHVNPMLDKNKNGDIIIVGIAEPDKALCNKKKTERQLPDSLFFTSLKAALEKKRPDLVMVYNAPAGHLFVAETCLPLGIPVMIEKPLSFSYAEAAKMKSLSEKYKTKVYTNYPSQWYPSWRELLKRAEEKETIHKMVMRGGHKGPAEIGCSQEFLSWLTDPVQNGGGALIDFGCYGAAVMTALMQGKAPVSVYAHTKKLKPSVYPRVDDAATIVLEYTGATGIIEASWNWPYTIMDVEVFEKNGYLHAAQFNDGAFKGILRSKNEKGTTTEQISAPIYKDEVEYLTAVLKKGATDDNMLLSLEYNIIVVKILEAARRSAREGKKVMVK